MLGKY